jgi:putative flavoprotein involved in K+ transport
MNESIDIVIIGAGQAGLSMSYYLTRFERRHVILEQASAITPAWRSRWDSFTLVIPNWTIELPGGSYQGDDPDGFMARDDLVAYLERYAATFNPEIRFDTQVTAIEKIPDRDNYFVHTDKGVIEANHVVIAAGTFQMPKIPAASKKIDAAINQIHSSQYQNPGALPDGAVLVVGTGQSGCQLAEELYQSGRKVYLCVGGATRIPRRYRGKDSIWWLKEMGFFDQTADTLTSSRERFKANPFVSGKDGGHSLDLHQFARDGVVLLGHLKDARGKKIFLVPDLHDSLAKVDQFVIQFKQGIDKIIEDKNIAAEEEPFQPEKRDGYAAEIIEELDLEAEGIHTIIWATGYRSDFSWIKLPLLDKDDYPIHDRGVSEFPGLYFLGLLFLHKRKSPLLSGIGEDAGYLAEYIAKS